MRYLRLVQGVLPALLFAATATAQSKPGLSFDQAVTAVTTASGRTDTATSVLHTTAVNGDVRVDLDNAKLVKDIGPFSAGSHATMIMHDGGKEMLILNPEKKEYLSIKLFEMMEGMQKMMASMGGSMTIDTSLTHASLDSIGPGPTIDGHPTLTYRLKTSLRMTMSMMGQQNTVDTRSTQEIQSAADMTNFVDIAASMNSFAGFSQAMGVSKDFFDNMVAIQRKMRGFPLRTVKHTTTSANNLTQTSDETIETRNIKRLAVPDSVFAIPAGYKPASMPAMPGSDQP